MSRSTMRQHSLKPIRTFKLIALFTCAVSFTALVSHAPGKLGYRRIVRYDDATLTGSYLFVGVKSEYTHIAQQSSLAAFILSAQ